MVILVAGAGLSSCEKFLEPGLDNRLTKDEMLNDPAFFEGLLLHAYQNMPQATSFDEAVASDEAVTNDKNSGALKMATGQWRSTFYPISKWQTAYTEINYINSFLADMDNVQWSWQSEAENENYLRRLKGEAYGLRAWWMFQLLQYHGGKTSDGSLLGFPVVTKPLTIDDDYSIPRSSYIESVDQILSDIDTAVKYLPNSYKDKSGDQVYNNTLGGKYINRISGLAALALKSRLTLLAASPAYAVIDWETAATTAGDIISANGGLSALSPTGVEYYKNVNDAEIIWSNSRALENDLEMANFPPSQYGEGNTNPTQDLVDAFPMQNGLPTDEPASGYDPKNPYVNRDPRLTSYIVFNGNTIKAEIHTDVDAPVDGIDKSVNSTRSGYYLKKFMLDDQVNLAPGNVTQAPHFVTYFRYTELFLNYAEAANEAWGPDADPMGYGFTPRQVISAIRVRGGLPDMASDTYLNSMTATREAFRELVQNERRIELSFEGFRFWDIRRWDRTTVMKNPVNGMFIDFNNTSPYSKKFVESRNYEDYMIYGPVPYEETLKYDLTQNQGW